MKNFKKIILTFISCALILIPSSIFALTEVKTEDDLRDALGGTEEIVLQNDITLTSALDIKCESNTINMNGHNIIISNGYIDLWAGKLSFTGKGTIKDTRNKERVSATIWVEGSTSIGAKDFVVLNIDKDITIETTEWAIAVSNPDSSETNYGSVVNFDGTIISTAKKGGGITVFGSVVNNGSLVNAPVINLSETASVTATGENAVVLYGAGMSVWNINGGKYTGTTGALTMKSGKFTVDGGLFTATSDPKEGALYGSGIIGTGAALQIESNNGYVGNMEINIINGTFTSEKGLSLYHYPKTGADNSLRSLIINNGTFNGNISLLSDDNVIVGNGVFSSDSVKDYLPETYSLVKEGNMYYVSNVNIISNNASVKTMVEGKEVSKLIEAGNEVTLDYTINKGYYFKSIKVVNLGTKEIVELKNNKFEMPFEAIEITLETGKLYNISILSNDKVSIRALLNNKDVTEVKPGETITIDTKVTEDYKIKDIVVSKVGDKDTKVTVKDGKFIMPEYDVNIDVITESKGSTVEVSKDITVSDSVDKEVSEDLSKVKVDNSNTGLKESVDTSKLEGVTENDKVEVSIDTKLESYDKEKNTLVFDIKPIYSVNGVNKGVIPNSVLTKSIKIELPVPSSVKDTHVKVIHKSGDKVLDTKNYEIMTRETGKYIAIETDSFSTFELSFYTPTEEKNPTTSDNSIGYILLSLISLMGIASGYGLLRKSMNK